jgi:3-hydroxybutyrate dehydrogenase
MNDSSRIVVVTGGGGGIGAACARSMARQGWHVVVCDIDKGRADAVASEVGGTSRALDIADTPAVETLASSV